MKDSFVFYTGWKTAVRDFPADVRLEIYEGIIEYAASGIIPGLKPVSKMAFNFIKQDIDRMFQKEMRTSESRRNAGKKGMQNRYSKAVIENVDCDENLTNLTKGNKPNYNDNVNDNLKKDINKLISKKEKFDFSFCDSNFLEIFQTWLSYKSGKKQTYKTQKSIQACYTHLVKLAGNDSETAKQIVEQSMANNWAGLFELKQTTAVRNQGTDIETYLKNKKINL